MFENTVGINEIFTVKNIIIYLLAINIIGFLKVFYCSRKKYYLTIKKTYVILLFRKAQVFFLCKKID